ncbi:MAG: hypothetical protein AB9856_06505 [Cellulosilyticaceae bacterium]
MKVRYEGKNGEQPYLTNKKVYTVISVEFENACEQSGEYIRYRLENDIGQIRAYKANMFDVECSKLSSTWIFNKKNENNYSIIAKDIAYNSFWEDFYNDDNIAVLKLLNVKSQIYLEDLSDSEIAGIIKDAPEEKLELILNALTQEKNNKFIEQVIDCCKLQLNKYSNESLLISAFRYLSTFKQNQVEEFFIEFLSTTLTNNEELIQIVNRYFND